jgi:hypothetical protein
MGLLLLFIAGVVVDLVITKYTRAVADHCVAPAVLYAMGITVINYGVLVSIVSADLLDGVVGIAVYAAGNGLGTWVAMQKGG